MTTSSTTGVEARRDDNTPIELNLSPGCATAPWGFKRFDANGGENNSHYLLMPPGFLYELLLWTGSVPAFEGARDPIGAIDPVTPPKLPTNSLSDVSGAVLP